jgi:4-amino-4-deoxy-L-arabinose transferase-like glycosyltransferase
LEGEAWWRWTAAAGLLVGVAFNTKMLAAWIPGPALALALVVGMEGAWWLAWRRWLPRLLLFGGVALAVSLSWMAVVEAWPSDSRPYVGGSTDNHVSGLILGYNGLDRVSSEPQAPNLGPSVASNVELNRDHNGPAALRMFNGENGGQIGWLLPLALIGGVVGLWRWRDRRVLRATLALWLAWLVLYGAVFSYMQGIYHPYYTYAMAPAIAVLVGAGTIAWSELARRHVAWAVAAAAAILLALWVQFEISSGHDGFYDWVRLPAAVVVIAGLAVFGAAMWRRHVTLLAGLVVVICGLSLLPAAWSSYEVRHQASGSISPRAGPREEEEPGVRNLRQIADEQEMSELAELLVAGRTEATVWDLVVDDAQDASILVLRQDLAVLPLGGFAGRDPTLTPAEFAELVAAGKVRYVWPSQSALRQGRAGTPQAVQPKGPGVDSVFAAVRAACEPATGVISPIRAFERDVVYDCEGRAAQLAAQ